MLRSEQSERLEAWPPHPSRRVHSASKTRVNALMGRSSGRGRSAKSALHPISDAAVDAAAAAHVKTIHMSWSKDGGRSGPRGYHHGNLKEALLRAALELDCQKRPGRVHLCGGRALGRRQPGGALSAFPRPRRTPGEHRAARLPAIRGGAGEGLERRPARSDDGVRPSRQSLSRVRAHRARLLLGDVRGRHSGRCQSGAARERRPRLRGAAQCDGASWSRPCRRRAVRRR